PKIEINDPIFTKPSVPQVKIAVARDAAFNFYYEENFEKRLLYEHSQSLEVILDSKVTDILVAWDFHKDKSTILLILNPTS
ncbi:hypothetical protein ABWK49_19110, partial [Priestia megaterium]